MLLATAAAAQAQAHQPFSREAHARVAFGNDASWYLRNIPFLEIDDPDIQRVYDYRWQVYRSHIREIGEQGTDETEFLPSVPWARHPYEDLNDSSSFHILEGRWMRDSAYVGSLVEHLYAGAGNDRHFSESIAAATLGWVKVTGDAAPAVAQLPAMEHVYNLWDDHFDAGRGLYWIEPLLDATEYTIGSIDASGAGFTDQPGTGDNRNGFTGGFAFRPSINAYQYGNARAIAVLLRLAGDAGTAAKYDSRAEALRTATLRQLWNPALAHFTDVYQRSTKTVKAGEFIRGRELVGFVPWQFELPPATAAAGAPDFREAWTHALSPAELGGPFGLRTVEPSYAKYMVQYRYDRATGLRECQWNGPSWPFQTSQTLTGMANLLDDYAPAGVTPADYLRLLRQYTAQHWNAVEGRLDLQEDYDPDTGKPIVGLPRSHHYLHSTYVDLVLSGLLGIRPHVEDIFEMKPLLPGAGVRPIRFFALEGLRYHGHEMTVVYDADGSRYQLGRGVSVWSDGHAIVRNAPLGPVRVALAPGPKLVTCLPIDVAVNVWGRAPTEFEPALPVASASSTAGDAGLYEPLDGRLWFFPEVPHGWSPEAGEAESWFGVDLRVPRRVGSVELAFLADGARFALPVDARLEVLEGDLWQPLAPLRAVANGVTSARFSPVQGRSVRLVFTSPAGRQVRLVSFRAYVSPGGNYGDPAGSEAQVSKARPGEP